MQKNTIKVSFSNVAGGYREFEYPLKDFLESLVPDERPPFTSLEISFCDEQGNVFEISVSKNCVYFITGGDE